MTRRVKTCKQSEKELNCTLMRHVSYTFIIYYHCTPHFVTVENLKNVFSMSCADILANEFPNDQFDF